MRKTPDHPYLPGLEPGAESSWSTPESYTSAPNAGVPIDLEPVSEDEARIDRWVQQGVGSYGQGRKALLGGTRVTGQEVELSAAEITGPQAQRPHGKSPKRRKPRLSPRQQAAGETTSASNGVWSDLD